MTEHVRRMEWDSKLIKGRPGSPLPSLREDRIAPCWSLTCSCGWNGCRPMTTLLAIRRWRKHLAAATP